jgi:hypothetical protein
VSVVIPLLGSVGCILLGGSRGLLAGAATSCGAK